MPEPKRAEQKAEPQVEQEAAPGRELLPASEATDAAVQQLLAERAALVANGRQEAAEAVTARLAELGYR